MLVALFLEGASGNSDPSDPPSFWLLSRNNTNPDCRDCWRISKLRERFVTLAGTSRSLGASSTIETSPEPFHPLHCFLVSSNLRSRRSQFTFLSCLELRVHPSTTFTLRPDTLYFRRWQIRRSYPVAERIPTRRICIHSEELDAQCAQRAPFLSPRSGEGESPAPRRRPRSSGGSNRSHSG